MAELEEYISSLITYTAFKNEKPDAAISYIPLEKLVPKDYNKKNNAYNFDKPQGAEPKVIDEEMDPPEFEVVNARELFKRFNLHYNADNLEQ